MKKAKNILLTFFFIIITMIFFSYKIVITYDTSHYLWLTSLFTDGEFSTWDVARGPIFPLFIRICNIFFGKCANGITVGTYIFYIIMLIFYYFMYKDSIKNEEFCGKKFKIFSIIVFFFLVVINPMIIGYYHTLLTEFFAITLSVVGCYLSWKWMNIDFHDNKKIYIIYTICLAFLSAIAWLLKQPYITTILFPTIIAGMISFIQKTNLKNFIQRMVTILVCAIFVIAGIKIWDFVLWKENVSIEKNRTSAGFFSKGFIEGLKVYHVIDNSIWFDKVEKIQGNEKIQDSDKNEMIKVLNGESEYKSFVVMDINEEKYKVIYTKDIVISTGESVKFLLASIGKEPVVIINNYITNYLETISVFDIQVDEGKVVVSKNIDFTNTKEIQVIGYKIYSFGDDVIFPLNELYNGYAESYREINNPIVCVNWGMRKLEVPVTIAMKIAYLLLPLLVIFNIIILFVFKKKYKEKYNSLIALDTILLTYSFLHILVHALMGCTIDRYTMPALSTTFVGILLEIYIIINRKKYKLELKKIDGGKGEKKTK